MRPGEASVPVHPRFDRQSVRAEQGDAHGPMAVGSRDVADEQRGLGEAVAVPDRQAGEALPMKRARPVLERGVDAEDVGKHLGGRLRDRRMMGCNPGLQRDSKDEGRHASPTAAGVDTDEVGNEAHPAMPTGTSNAVRMPSHHGWRSNRRSLALQSVSGTSSPARASVRAASSISRGSTMRSLSVPISSVISIPFL